MKPTPRSIVDEIAAAIPKKQSLQWHVRVAPEHRETLDAIREAYKAGRFGTAKKPAHTVIANIITARGIAKIGRNGVAAWLEGY